jgi:hypothetical protein
MEGKIISLKHARLRKRDEEMDRRNKEERNIELFLESILEWWGSLERQTFAKSKSNFEEEPPDFVRIAKEINEIGIEKWLEEQTDLLYLLP